MNYYLKNAFENLGKSQKEIIKDLNRSQPYISALMSGEKQVGKKMAEELVRLYGFDYASILRGSEQNVSIGDGNNNINSNISNTSELDKLLKIIENQGKQIERKDKQIDELIDIIKKKTEN